MTLTILAKTIKLKCQTYMDNRIIAIIISQQVLFFSTKLHPLSSQMIQRQWTSSWLFASFSRWCLHISFVPPPPASRPHCPCRSIPPRCLLGSENASSPLRYTWLGLLFFMEMKSADPLLSQSLLHRDCPATKPPSVSSTLHHSQQTFQTELTFIDSVCCAPLWAEFSLRFNLSQNRGKISK